MGEYDISERSLESWNDVFADVVNGSLFGGREVVREDELEDAAPYSVFKADGLPHQQERDVAKYWRRSLVRIAFFGIENQTEVDKKMPARVIAYDGGAYKAQLLAKNGLCPVITIVLYFGTEHEWNGPTSLSECLDVHPELVPYFNDYKIHVVNVAFLTDEELDAYRSDFRIAAEYFVQARRTGVYAPRPQPVRHVNDTLQMMQTLTGDRRFERVLAEGMEGRDMTMIDMLSAYENRGVERGIIQGREQGLTLGREQGLTLGREQGLTLGREQGLTLGREQGLTLGREQGLTLGREQGLMQGRVDTARNMLINGFDRDMIAKCTHLPLDLIDKIADELGR